MIWLLVAIAAAVLAVVAVYRTAKWLFGSSVIAGAITGVSIAGACPAIILIALVVIGRAAHAG